MSFSSSAIPAAAVEAAAIAAAGVFNEPVNARDRNYIQTILEAAAPHMRQAFILEINLRAVQDELNTPLQFGNDGTWAKAQAKAARLGTTASAKARELLAKWAERTRRPARNEDAMNITEFLEARIAEDEAQANNVLVFRMNPHTSMPGNQAIPARVLAECAAKRAIIEQYETHGAAAQGAVSVAYIMARGGQRVMDGALRALAAVYADHPDYQQEWATDTPAT